MSVRKKGFTLVELLAVIVVLGIILVIAIPNVVKIIDQAKIGTYNNQMELFKDAAGRYLMLYPDEFEDPNNVIITLDMLMDKNLIDKNIKNPITKEPYENIGVNIKKEDDQYVYEIITSDDSGEMEGPRQPKHGEIVIDTAEKLAKIGIDPNYPLSGSYIQMANINLSNYTEGEGWLPIGNYFLNGNKFSGKYDGNSFVISNLTIKRKSGDKSYQGLFGRTSSNSELSNITLINSNINIMFDIDYSSLSFGSLVGQNEGSISFCKSIGCAVVVLNGIYAGGLVGYNSGSISSSYSTIIDSGYIYGGGNVGGLVGYNSGSIISSYSIGSVRGNSYVGGLVGNNTNTGSIASCYSTGPVNGGANIGGLLGFDSGGSVSSCYWDKLTSNQAISAGGAGAIGKTTTEMKKRNTFSNWDFISIWQIDENASYPYLRNNEQIPHP